MNHKSMLIRIDCWCPTMMSIKEENVEGYLFVMLSFRDFTTVVETLKIRMLG